MNTLLLALFPSVVQALVETIQNVNAALQPPLRATLKLSTFKPVHVPPALQPSN
jgi:hypothetical protein